MSFDLAVWYEGTPVSHGDAAAKYELLHRNVDVGLAEHPGLAALYADLVARYPTRGCASDVDHDQVIWSAESKIVAHAVRLSIAVAAVALVHPVVEELAEREGLACFDPQQSRVRLPSAMRLLQMYGGLVQAVTEPNVQRVAQAVVQTAHARSHLVLEKGTERYVQVSPALHGTFGVEYREGGPERHFRFETGDLSEVKDIFESYTRGDDGWRHQHGWTRFQL